MKLLRKRGSTSNILQIFIQDSTSSSGLGLTGLTNASAGLTAYYHRDTDVAATVIALVGMTSGTFTSGGFVQIDSANMPGWYQFCPPDAAFLTGALSVGFHLKGAASMAPLPIEVDLDGQVDVTFWNGTAVAAPATAGIPDVNVKNVNNIVSPSPTAIRSGTAQAGAATTITLDAGASASNNFYNNDLIVIVSGTGANQSRFITAYNGGTKVATVATWVTNPDATSVFVILPFDAVAGATAPTAAQVATAVWQDTTGSDFTVGGSVGKGLFTSGAVPGAAGGVMIAGANASSSFGGYTLVDPWGVTLPGAYGGGLAGNLLGNHVSQTFTTALTESYAALHAAPTLAQILFEMRGLFAEKAVASTTLTINGINGSTPKETFTLNDGTNPTAITRAT
jgi:hypothetical protein